MENVTGHSLHEYHTLTPSGAYALRSVPRLTLDPNEIEYNRMTRMKTIHLHAAGIIDLEPINVDGELHQFNVNATGCATSLIVLCNTNATGFGKDKLKKILVFPVLQSGSFKLEASFHNGLRFYICANVDSPPHMTVNWRVANGLGKGVPA